MELENFYRNIFTFLENHLNGKYWLWKLIFTAVFISIFLAFPSYTLLVEHLKPNGVKLDAWLFIHNQAVDLLNPKDYSVGIRREAMVFRWVLPALYFLAGHRIWLVVLFQGFLAVLFLYLIGRISFQIFASKSKTALIVLAISNIFVGTWGFSDIHGYGDGIAYFFLLLAIISSNPVIIFASILVGCFTDERAVIAGGYVIIFWTVQKCFETNQFDFKTVLRSLFTNRSQYVWYAWFVYGVIRLYVKFNYFQNHIYSKVGEPVMLKITHRAGIGSSIWSNFEGTWLILLAGMMTLILLKRNWLLFVFIAGFAILLTTGLFVHDIDRAYGYGFPFILSSLVILRYTATDRLVSLLLFFTALICITQPQVFTMGYNQIIWAEPLPVKILTFLDRKFHWGFFM